MCALLPFDLIRKVRNEFSMSFKTYLNNRVTVIRTFESNVESLEISLMITKCFKGAVKLGSDTKRTASLACLVGVKDRIMNSNGITFFLDSVEHWSGWNWL